MATVKLKIPELYMPVEYPPTMAGLKDMLISIGHTNLIEAHELEALCFVTVRVRLKLWALLTMGIMHWLYLRKAAAWIHYWKPVHVWVDLSVGPFNRGIR